jgi:hypothetical protein
VGDGATRAAPVPTSPATDLYGFAAEQPAWQGELIRRVYERGAVQEQDVADGVKMVRQSEGLEAADGPVPAPLRPIDPQNTAADPSVRLLGVSDLVSVNRLPRGARLRFAELGLTVVYGENGSGKSGYCRVIKAACGGGPVVLPDVFAPGADTTSATITYSVDGTTEAFEWTAGAVLPDSLARVTVFDAVRAPLYVDEERRLGFLPRGLEVLPALGRMLTAMGEQFDADLRLAAAGIPIIGVHAPPGTSVRRLLDRLVPGETPPSDDEIDAIAHLTGDERSELTQLETSFARDPAATAGRLEAAAARLRSLDTAFRSALEVLSPEAGQGLIELIRTLDEARQAAQLVSQAAFDGVTVLPAAGSEPWRLMFEYARAYMAIAAPDRLFPDASDDAVCPLCQQVLGPDARDRLRHFAEFMTAEAQARLADLSRRVDEARKELSRIWIPTQLDVSALGLVDPEDVPGIGEIAAALEELRVRLEARRRAMAELDAGGTHDFPTAPTAAPGLPELALLLEDRAGGLRTAAGDETRTGLLHRLEELRARAALEGEREAVGRLRSHLEMIAALRRCKAACDTTAISRKNSELRHRYLSAEFERNFREELARLGLENLAVRPADRTERGEHLVSIALDAAMRARIREVLSDGEIRAVGLAGFLADCRRIGASPPIVLDDPVSSLDHQRIRAVAERLVDESQRRQVVVFTHSILFLWELWDQAVARRVSLAPQWLRVEGGVPGALTEDTVPWEAAGVGTRLGGLEQRLAEARRIGDLTGEEFRRAVRLYYGDLRDTWERLVEELLFNGVIGRFTPGVHTQRLRMVEVTDDDFRIIDTNVTRASQFEHSQALGREQSLPTHPEMEADLRALRDFRDAIRARLQVVGRRRQVAQRPPTA